MLEFIQPERLEQGRPPPGQLRQVRFGQQRQQQVPGADARRLRVQRRDQPGVLEQLGQMRRKHRRARVARRAMMLTSLAGFSSSARNRCSRSTS
ncbi:hypothetical protein G6F40_017646 [Rhizopus arrhizus]|nr:hypothetical protein G6F40_017646 [Rhizopus arrhizus]